MEKLRNNWISVFLLVLVLAGLSWFVLKKNISPEVPVVITDTPVIKPADVIPRKQNQTVSNAPNIPKYVGRDPEEIRPNPEDVKIFSDKRKEEIYGGIGVHGKIVKENPDFLTGWLELGILKKIIGDYEGARDAWEYAGIVRPGNSISFANLGELYSSYMPNYAKAEANFKISIKNKPSDFSVYTSLSDLYLYSYAEKKDLADDILLEGIQANPEDTNFVRALAVLYERQKEYTKAKEWWSKFLEKEPGDTEVAAYLKELEGKINP